MCLILLAYQAHPRYRLIVAANRDESYGRPTEAARFWPDEPTILAGRDLEKMGTWMGVSASGRFAALTNYRDPQEMKAAGKRSRGELVADYLREGRSPLEYLNDAALKKNSYPGYNLLAGDRSSLYYYSNIENTVREVLPGIHGLSNHMLNTPWPKVRRGKEGLEQLMKEDGKSLRNGLFNLLQHADPAPDSELPDTGVGIELERLLSPLFIKSEGYGTRCSTLLLVDESSFVYTERNFGPEGYSDRDFLIPFI